MAKQRLIDRFPQYRDKYHTDLVADLHANERSAMIGHFLVIWTIIVVKWTVLPHFQLLWWGGALTAALAFRGALYHRYQHRAHYSEIDVKWHTMGIATCALAWSCGFLTILPYCGPGDIPFLMMVIAVISASAIISLSARLKSYAIFSTLLVVPCVLGMFFSSNTDYATGSLAIIFLLFCGSGVKRANQVSQSAMIRRYQNSEIMRNLGQAKRQLEKAVQSAEAANLAKQEFLANVSHEIRTPMNGVLGMTDLVLESDLTEEQRNYLDTARRCGMSLLHLIDELLDFSKIEAGKMDIEKVPFELAPLVQDLVAAHRANPKTKAEILLHIDANIPATLVGDPHRVRQVLNNLVGNAVKFTPRGFIRVTASQLKENGEQYLELSVTDEGIGIPADRLANIFDSFTQADGSTTRNFGGTGLGLTISRKLAELMGGILTVQSDVGVGSSFTVTLPLQEFLATEMSTSLEIMTVGESNLERANQLHCAGVDAQPGNLDGELWNIARGLYRSPNAHRFLMLSLAEYNQHSKLVIAFLRHFHCQAVFMNCADEPLPLAPGLRYNGAINKKGLEQLLLDSEAMQAEKAVTATQVGLKLRILVAEDHSTNATIVRRMLESMGHEVEVAVNGKAAVDAFLRHGADLILMDLQMPVMGGHDACRAIRKLDDGKDLPILALTAHATAEERQLSMEAGMDDHLTKPFTREQLTNAIQLWGTSHRSPEKLA